MKNKFIAILLAVAATFTFSQAAFAQHNGHNGGGHNGGYHNNGPVYHGPSRGYDHGNRGWDNRGWNNRGYDYRGWNNYRGYDRGYRGFSGRDFAWGLGLGYLLNAPRYYSAPRYYYYDAPVRTAPVVQYYVDQYGREYYLDYDGYAVFTGRTIR